MKELHLLCNAHLDPVWLWQRQEGMAEAISTFRVAAKFCEEYDGFVFNHNESLLYEWVEEYEPQLFEKIKKLVKEGKWHIMGGWYLQPDCMMPSGESFIRQIETGNNYFMEKFGVKPTTAINVDPFGHTRGLVQILNKCGYDSYLFMRPHNFGPARDFIWEGYDKSKVYAHCLIEGYNTNKGMAVGKIDRVSKIARDGANAVLWGIGNHGGGPSKVDLDAICKYAKEHDEVKIIHSWPEKYFDEIDKTELETVDTSICHCMVGCYTSMVRIKQMHRLLENELAICEKMIASSGISYDKKEFENAVKALLFCEFHDVLPGSMIKKAEDDCLRLLNYGRETVSKICVKAFFEMCKGQAQGKEGEIPVIVYNPNPYWAEQDVEVEFQLQDQNWTENECTIVKVRDEDGNYLPTQNEKESSSIHLDWRKKVVFRAKLKPMSINRFDCELNIINADPRPIAPCEETATHFIVKAENMVAKVNKNTGLLDKYEVDGVNYLKENSAKILSYKDNEDPWGMTVDEFTDCIGEFEAVSDKEANIFNGYDNAEYKNVRVIENGDVRCKIQAIFKNDNSYAVVTYAIPKQGKYIDIKIKTFANDSNRMYKLSFNTDMNNPDFMGQSAFGREKMIKDEKEITYQKWCAFTENDKGFAIINKGTYAGSAKDNIMNITLLRTPIYSAHPIGDRTVTDPDRNHDRIDMGEREFEYRLTTDIKTLDKEAEIYNQPLYALSFFPSGDGEKKNTMVELDNDNIIMSRFSLIDDNKVLIRLFNSSEREEKVNLTVYSDEFKLSFKPFEFKTYELSEGKLSERNVLNF